MVYLLEADVLGVLTEASSADHQSVLADETVSVLADAAEKRKSTKTMRNTLTSKNKTSKQATRFGFWQDGRQN